MKNIVRKLVGWGRRDASWSVSSVCALFMLGFAVLAPRSATAYIVMDNDRMLLMNNDSKFLANVSSQDYYDTNTTKKTYWVHSSETPSFLVPYLLKGITHTMYKTDGTVLWHLTHCRAGSGTIVNSTARNYIPWSTTAKAIGTGATKIEPTTAGAKLVASVVMRNTTDSCLYSPYYKEGIGTLYFDAVNAFVNDVTGQIGVEISTNVTEDAAVERNITFDSVTTNYEELVWHPLPCDVFAVENVKTLTALEKGVTNIALAATAGMSNYFYRIRSKLNYRQPIRFRIRRLSKASGALDTAGLILLDNIIASYPPATVELKRHGSDYNPEKKGTSVLGCTGELTKPFASFMQEDNHPRLAFAFVTNSAAKTAVRIENPMFHYRWRYLGQVVDAWRTIPFDQTLLSSSSTTNFELTTETAIPFTNGVGDLEFFYTAKVNGHYYYPQDYACGVRFGADWTEAITSVTNRGSVTNPMLYNSEMPTPAGGTDYFVRIREGESDYERVDFCAYLGTNTFATTNYAMELVSDHTWRYHYHMPTNLAMVGQRVGFYFNAVNKQTSGAKIYARNNTLFKLRSGVAQVPYLPFTSVAEVGGVDGVVLMTNVATHLVFEFNDETGAFTVSRGGYQDFNAWTDAKGSQYVGNYVTTSGVSDVKTLYTCDFNRWNLTLGTNSWWSESFSRNNVELYPFDQHFSTWRTPNGWRASNGMFVSTDRTNKVVNVSIVDSATRAFQMDGGGVGAIELSDLPANGVPQGVDTFSFKARVAQQHSFDGFLYALDYMGRRQYAFSAEVAMSVLRNGSDMSPGTPTVSLVGYYRPTKGCYEFRIRRLTGSGDTGTGELELSLWKWQQNAAGTGMEAVRLTGGSSANGNGVVPSSDSETRNPIITSTASSGSADYKGIPNLLVPTESDRDYKNWTSCYISVYTDASGNNHVVGAMAKKQNTNGVGSEGGANFVYIYCKDTSNPLAKGSFGVGSTDCQAHFGMLKIHPATAETEVDLTDAKATKVANENSDWEDWANWNGSSRRFDTSEGAGGTWTAGVKALVPDTWVEMSIRNPGSDANATWQRVAVTNVASFKMSDIVFQPQITDLCYVRLATTDEGGSKADIVVDDLEVRQWRGQTDTFLTDGSSQGLPNDWTYTESWVVSNGVVATNMALKLQPRRGSGEVPMGLRTPWLKQGLSLFSFAYANADENAALLLQIATNNVSSGRLKNITYLEGSLSASEWTTVTNFSFRGMTAEERLSGTLSYSMSLRAPVGGLVRVIVDPAVVAAASTTNAITGELPSPEYGQVTITSALCYDEPPLDDRSWWGWNLLTTGWDSGVANAYAYLTDWSTGLSAGLNWSGTTGDNANGTELKDAEKGQYQQHDPFIQSPPLECGIGNVSFRARKMYGATQDVASVVRLMGASDKNAQDADWKELAVFTVDCPTYRTFSWKTTSDRAEYKVVRLVVPGVKGGRDKVDPLGQRVLIDEVTMAEPISPKVAFINVAPFRTDLSQNVVITNILSMDQQPLLGESFGIQVEIEPQQMGDELDMDHVRVFMSYSVGEANWGIENKDRWTHVDEVELTRVGTNLIFRSTYDNVASIIPPQDGKSVVVQYCVRAVYWDKGQDVHHDEPHRHVLTAEEWSRPSWYRGLKEDLNDLYAASGFTPYTILESISPRRAWINEVNYYDGLDDNKVNLGATNQYVEVAVPAGGDLTGWWMQLVDTDKRTCELVVFGGSSKVTASKTANATNRYVFLTLRGPTGTAVTEADGTWKSNLFPTLRNGVLDYRSPYALRLIRPSGILEHEIIFAASDEMETGLYGYLYHPTNFCTGLNRAVANAQFRVVGRDIDAGSLGVYRSHGENGEYPDDVTWQDVTQCSWTNSMRQTPTRVNQLADGTLQDIDANYYLTPNGTNVWIYADVSGGHIKMKSGTNLVEHAVIVLPMEHNTNIVFVLDRWYDVATLTTNGVSVDVAQNVIKGTDGTFSYKVENVKSQVNLVATAGPNGRMRDLGVSESRYRDAIMHWMQQYDDDVDVQLAKFRPLSKFSDTTGASDTLLSLVDMYWLNIPPTDGGWLFVAGIGGWGQGTDGSPVVAPYEYTNPATGDVGTNVTIRMTMFLTNTVTHVAHAPDRLQGLEPGSTSYDSESGVVYDPSLNPNWTSVTFKVTGALQNGKVNDVWQPLRWFVFGPDSFDENFTATIDIHDPFKPDSSTAAAGWGSYRGTPVFYRWAIDDRLRPDTTEMLKSDSRFSIHPDKTNP